MVREAVHPIVMPEAASFIDYWLAETVRLREAHWGPLEDAREVRRARAQGHGFPQQVVLRAQFLAQREKIDHVIANWIRGGRFALAIMLFAALLIGASAALGALGDGSRPVNLLLALAGMLGLHSITFVLWLLSFAVKRSAGGTWLGQLWLWLTRKLAHGPDAALTPRALVELLGRNTALRWVLSGVTHALWTSAFLGLLATLLAMLSARRYSFNWETTLLPADTFVHFTRMLGWLPAQVGFAIPPDDVVRASNGLHGLPESAQALWSGWLIGCVVVYGLAPRLISLIVSLILAKKRIAAVGIDETLPGYASLRDRLQPHSEKLGMDEPAPDGFQARISPSTTDPAAASRMVLAGIELPPEMPWPPLPLDHTIGDLGIVDTRSQRQTLLDRLHRQPVHKLLIACDARQTPDRGTISLAADLAGVAQQTHVVLLQGDGAENRNPAWRERLAAAGFEPDQIHLRFEAGLGWLRNTEAEGDPHGNP